MRRLSTMLLAGLLVLIGSAPGEARAPSAQPESDARCLSSKSPDELFVAPPGFRESVGEGHAGDEWSRRVFRHDDGRMVIEDIHQRPSPSDAMRRAASTQAGLSNNPEASVTVSVPCGTRTLTVTAMGATPGPDQQGPHPNALLALDTILTMVG